MPSKRSNGFWRGRVKIRGREITKSGFKTKRDAAEWERIERGRQNSKSASEKTGITLLELCEAYLDYSRRFRRKVHLAKRLVCKTMIGLWGPEILVDDISPAMAVAYLEGQAEKVSANSSNVHRKDAVAMWNWGMKIHGIKSNPWAKTEKRAHDRAPQYVPPPEDIIKLRMAATRDEQVLLDCYLQTGARKSEIFRLTWDDVNLEHRQIRIGTRKTKDGSMQYDWLTMSGQLFESMQWQWKSRDKSSPWVFTNPKTCTRYTDRRKFVRRLCKRAGIKPFGFHGLRRYVASVLADSGKVSLVAIQKLLRHQSIETTRRYIYDLRADYGGAGYLRCNETGDGMVILW